MNNLYYKLNNLGTRNNTGALLIFFSKFFILFDILLFPIIIIPIKPVRLPNTVPNMFITFL
ncbi:MAG: hypothetical protein AABW89_04250 [Nanoarchaeota archaeon]